MTESVSERTPPTPDSDATMQTPISTKPLVSKETRKSTIIISVIVAVVAIAVLVGIGYLMYKSYDWAAAGAVPATVRLRDIAFVVMALETFLIMLLILLIVVLIVVVIVLIYDRVIPILEQVNRAINTAADTVHTVRGTTEFVSEKVVTPLIEVSGYAAGIARIAKGIAGLWPRKRGAGEGQGVSSEEE
ncbi:MAG: hypothetical protein JXA09_17645 [Anaerolineae bacterium]|nr:hypothetical protein [Anaerolineae bacterium]